MVAGSHRGAAAMKGVSSGEVLDLLRDVGNGKIVPSLTDPAKDWLNVFAGEVYYTVGEWEVAIFNDCDD